MEWMPIETAPKDGTEVLGATFIDNGEPFKPMVEGPYTMAWVPRNSEWVPSWDRQRVIEYQSDFGTEWKTLPMRPTHWMPLPPPPKGEA